MSEDPAKGIKWDKNGLLPCVLQNAATGEVLTLAYMNAESFAETLRTGQIVFWSRSRKELWRKGETSGNTMRAAFAALQRGAGLVFADAGHNSTNHHEPTLL